MAKKKRKKGKRPQRPAARPAQPKDRAAPAEAGPEAAGAEPERRPQRAGRGGAAAAAAVSNRQARKEQARRERERRLKRARRRRRMRRIVRWAVVLGAVGGIAFAIWYFNTRPIFLEGDARQAAAALGCGPNGDGGIEEPGAAGAAQHLAQGEPPPEYPSTPAASGRHSPTTYQGPPVLEEPVTPEVETNLVHNLEHAYVIMYYRAEGDAALPEEVVDRLTQIAERENKVLLAPYPDLPDDTSLTFTAWNKLLPCPDIDAGEAGETVTVAEGFIDQYRGTSNAPEPASQ